MKKFRSFKTEEEKPEKKSKAGMYLAIFIAVVMIGGVGGIILGNQDNDSEFTYGKYSFSSKNNEWMTKIDKKEISFYFMPQEVEHLDVSGAASQLLKKSAGIIITYNPNINSTEKLQAIDIFKFKFEKTMSDKNKQIGFAVTETTNLTGFPAITCSNSSFTFPVMSIEYSNETKAELINECIVISAENEKTLLAIMENLRYRLYGVIDEKN